MFNNNQNFKNKLNAIYSIPLLGPVLRAGKLITPPLAQNPTITDCFGTGNSLVDNTRVQYDIADLNPVRALTKLVKQTESAFENFYEGIWFGKRTLSISPIGLTIKPGMDLYHYAIAIDGILYQLGPGTKGEGKRVKIDSNPYDIDSFEWVIAPPKNRKCEISKKELDTFVKNFESKYIYKVLPEENNETNCQDFVIKMYSHSANITIREARQDIERSLGNIFF